MTALTLADLKNFLRYDGEEDDQDVALGIILKGGQSWIERYTGHLLTQREIVETPRGFGTFFELRWKPFSAGSLTIGYRDAGGDEQEIGDARVITENGAERVYPSAGGSWPSLGSPAGITLTYTAGYAVPDEIPEVLLLALGVFAAMSDEERAGGDSASWAAIKALIEDFHMPVLV